MSDFLRLWNSFSNIIRRIFIVIIYLLYNIGCYLQICTSFFCFLLCWSSMCEDVIIYLNLFLYLKVKSLLLLFSWFYIQYTYPGYNRTCQHHVGRAPSTWGDSCTWFILNQLYFTSILVIITSSGCIDHWNSVCSLQIEWIYIIYLLYGL